jgi:hypothetical protein
MMRYGRFPARIAQFLDLLVDLAAAMVFGYNLLCFKPKAWFRPRVRYEDTI